MLTEERNCTYVYQFIEHNISKIEKILLYSDPQDLDL